MIKVSLATYKDTEGILDVYRAAHPEKPGTFTRKWWDWFMLWDFPDGCWCYVAKDGKRVIGAWIRHEIELTIGFGSMASNAAVHPDYQKRGVFTKINRFAQRDAKANHERYSLGVWPLRGTWGSNLGWEPLCELHWLERSGPINEIPERKSPRLQLYPIKTPEELHWRYSRPGKWYYAAHCGNSFIICDGKGRIMDMEFSGTDEFNALLQRAQPKILWQPDKSPYLDWFVEAGFKPNGQKQILKSNLGPIEGLPETGWWFMLGDYDVF